MRLIAKYWVGDWVRAAGTGKGKRPKKGPG